MSEFQEVGGKESSIPEDFLSEYPLAFPTQYSLVKTRVEKYNQKHQTNYHPVDIALALNAYWMQVLSIPQKEVISTFTAQIPEQVNIVLESSWKNYVYPEVFQVWENSESENIDTSELEKIILALMWSDISLSDEEKYNFRVIIDFFIGNNSAFEVFSFLKEDSFSRVNRSIDEYQNYNSSYFETYFRDYIWTHTSMTEIYDTYRKSLWDISDTDLQVKVLQFLRTIVKIRRYVNIPSVIGQNQKIQEAKLQEKQYVMEKIYPLMLTQAQNNEDISLSSPEAIFATLLRKYLFSLKKQHLKYSYDSEFPVYVAWILHDNRSYYWSVFQDYISQYISQDILSDSKNSEQNLKRAVKILLENDIDFSWLYSSGDRDEMYAIWEQKKQDEIDRENEEHELREQKKQERYNSKEKTLSFLFWVIQSELEKVKGDISKAVDNLKRNSNSEIWKLIKHHNITAQDMIQSQLYRIEQEHSNKFERKVDIFWQKVCSVFAELVSWEKPHAPISLTTPSSSSQIAYLIFSSQYAELRNHLPDGVYEDTIEAHFKNLERVRSKQERDSRSEFDFLDRINDERSRTQDQKIKTFYNTTRAIPAWWISPDWKKMTLLKDSIWDLIRKNRIQKEQVVWGFEELVSQLQRQIKQIHTLELNWRERLNQEERSTYDNKKLELDAIKSTLWSEYAEFFTEDGRSESFYKLLGAISSEIFLWESLFEQALKIQDELWSIKNTANSIFQERKNTLSQMIRELQSWKQLYIEEFVWSSGQRVEKQEKARREKASRRIQISNDFWGLFWNYF